MSDTNKTKAPKGPPQVSFLLDESGSMLHIKEPTVAAVNAYMDALRGMVGLIEFSLVKFGDRLGPVYEFQPIADVPPFRRDQYNPEDSTALHMAIHRQIQRIIGRVGEDARVIFVIQTDGGEDADWSDTKREIQRLTKKGWTFLLMQARDPNRVAAAKRLIQARRQQGEEPHAVHLQLADDTLMPALLGIPASNVVTYSAGGASKESFDAFMAAALTTQTKLAGG